MQASNSQQRLHDGEQASSSSSLWTDILNSVTDSRSVVVKQLVVLGTPKSGKSTLISRLDSSSSAHGPSLVAPLAARSTSTGGVVITDSTSDSFTDVGLGYSYFDVRDEDQETIARCGTFQAASVEQARAVLPLVLNEQTILDTLVVITLDCERPWLFVRQLEAWIIVLRDVLDKFRTSEQAVQARERVEASLKRKSSESTSSTVSLAAQDLPLPEGTLVENLGVPVVIACTKGDYIAALERDTLYKDEHFDNIQQVLRTIALYYGSAAFYTSISRNESFDRVRHWILYKLFGESSSSSTARTLFAFKDRPNVVDRDQLFVPAGWDSWGKIRLTRESFDPSVIVQAWEQDLSSSDQADASSSTSRAASGAIKMYEQAIPDAHAHKRIARAKKPDLIVAQPEQEFLKAQYDILLKEREKDPRAAFASRPDPSAQRNDGFGGSASLFTPSVVGPMSASSSLRMPNVERAFDKSGTKDDSIDAPKSSSTASRKSPNSQSTATFSSPTSQPTGTGRLPSSLSTAASASATGSASAGTGGAQNEVLANFFQSLLEKRSTVPSSNTLRDSPAR